MSILPAAILSLIGDVDNGLVDPPQTWDEFTTEVDAYLEALGASIRERDRAFELLDRLATSRLNELRL